MLATCVRKQRHSEEDTFMTHTSRTPLYRHIAVALFAVAVTASALPAQAQHYRRGGYHGRPVPQYRDRGYRDHRGGGNGNLIAGALLGVIAGTVIANSAERPPPAVVYSTAPPPPPPGVVYYDDDNPPPPDDGY
jgi:hypothetical protein